MILIGAMGSAVVQALVMILHGRSVVRAAGGLELPKIQPPCPGLDGNCVVRPRGHVQPCWDGTPDADRLRRL